MRFRHLLALAALAVGLLPGSGVAATPTAGAVSSATTTTSWTGGPFVTSNPSGLCVAPDPACDTYALSITAPASGDFTVEIAITPSSEGDDYDLSVAGPDGKTVASSASSGGHESVTLTNPATGTYLVRTLAWLVAPGGTYSGTATLKSGTAPQAPTGSVLYTYDTKAPQAKAQVPLRVIAVGFKPGELDESTVLGQIPTSQRPGVIIPRGKNPSGDNGTLFGLETLVNHGRRYYDSSTPFLVPYEYDWKPQLVYASDAFANGLFAAMAANSTTGEFSNSRNRAFIETYNTSRGAYRGAGKLVAPNAPVRFVDGEKTEDWIAANAPSLLGFDFAARGKGPGKDFGYTVFLINSWDSPQAVSQLKPEHEYHVWKINRTDPDTGDFDGIDWARVWGGRYRFMMVDSGAAPNPYEAETWGNRNRSVYGSAIAAG